MLPKLNATVRVPADRGDKPYTGTVVHVGESVERNHANTPFVWTTVRHPSGTKHVWPSNRIGYQLTDEDIASLTQPRAPAPVSSPVPSPEAAPPARRSRRP
jgi:hypothetical protein